MRFQKAVKVDSYGRINLGKELGLEGVPVYFEYDPDSRLIYISPVSPEGPSGIEKVVKTFLVDPKGRVFIPRWLRDIANVQQFLLRIEMTKDFGPLGRLVLTPMEAKLEQDSDLEEAPGPDEGDSATAAVVKGQGEVTNKDVSFRFEEYDEDGPNGAHLRI